MTINIFNLFEERALASPESVAVHYEGGRITYRELLRQALQLSALLRSQGVGRGDSVMMFSPNAPEYLSVFFACAHVGAVFAPVNDAFRMKEMHFIAGNAKADVAFVHTDLLADYVANIEGSLHAPSRIFVVGGREEPELPGAVAMHFALPESDGSDAADVQADTPCLIVYTSGSTSQPKAVLHSHGSVLYQLQTYAEIWDYREDDVAVVSPPMSWVFGLILTSAAMATVGTAVVLLRRFHPVRVLEAVEKYKATLLFGTMSMYAKMMDVLQTSPFEIGSLRFCMVGGEPCPDSVLGPVEERFGMRFCQAWAFSENHPLVAMRPGDGTAPRGTAGKPAPGVEIRICDAGGKPIDGAATGEAWVRGPGAMTCYLGNPSLTAEKIDGDGWICTGDLLSRDADGYVSVVGRASDMIIRSGANIAPAEVETALLEHEGVASACVVGIPARRSGEVIVAFIRPVAGGRLDGSEILEHLDSRLARYKLPQEIIQLDSLPVTANDKIDRQTLKRIAADRLPEYSQGKAG